MNRFFCASAILRRACSENLYVLGTRFANFVAAIFACVSNDGARPSRAARRLARCSSDLGPQVFPLPPAPIAARWCSESGFPRFASDNLRLVSSVTTRPRLALRIFMRVASECFSPMRVSRHFSTCSGVWTLPRWASLTRSLCQSAMTLPLWAAPILALCPSVSGRPSNRSPKLLPAVTAMLYAGVKTLSARCSKKSKCDWSQSNRTENSNVSSPYFSQAVCSFRLWWRFALSVLRCSHQRLRMSIALPTYSFPSMRLVIL